MEQPDLSQLLQRAQTKGYSVDPSNATYFIGHVTIVPREGLSAGRHPRVTEDHLRHLCACKIRMAEVVDLRGPVNHAHFTIYA
jgi:hypothetical protein